MSEENKAENELLDLEADEKLSTEENSEKKDKPSSLKSKALKTLKSHVVSYHDAVQPLAWYLYPAKDFAESNYKNAGKLYKLPSKKTASDLFFEAELSGEGYKLLSGRELNRFCSLAIRHVREHVKH